MSSLLTYRDPHKSENQSKFASAKVKETFSSESFEKSTSSDKEEKMVD